MLAIYTSRGVTPEVNLRDHISHTPLQSLNKAEPTLALKPKNNFSRKSFIGKYNLLIQLKIETGKVCVIFVFWFIENQVLFE